MALFRWFKRREKKNQKEIPEESEKVGETGSSETIFLDEEKEKADEIAQEPVKFEKEKINIDNSEERIAYLQRLFEGIQIAKRHCTDVKFEYGQVTSYLKDIQLIDQAPRDDKVTLYMAARRIVELLREREHLQKQQYKMTTAQRRAMETFESSVEDDMMKLAGYEEYQMKIKNDLRQLGSEKSLLMADQHDIIERQSILKSIGKILTIIMAAFGAMMLALVFCFKVDITVPFLATVSFAFVIAAIILNEARKNRIDMVITEKKCNRAIFLSNRVKLKYFNNVRTLEYMNQKYHVRNATELDFVYGQYRKAKREWERQREGTAQLRENHNILMIELKKLGVKDREIWYSQARAIIDPKEMVEIRHDLNERRRNLREQLDYNNGIIDECMEEIDRIRERKPEYEREVRTILGQGPS